MGNHPGPPGPPRVTAVGYPNLWSPTATSPRPAELLIVLASDAPPQEWIPRGYEASAKRLRQHGHSPSKPLTSAANADGWGSVMIALNANGAR